MAAASLAREVGGAPACRALGVARATFYRRRKPTTGHQQPRQRPARALDESEREKVRETLACPRFVDRSPAEVVATLLDEGEYLCSERTMYRILQEDHPVRERRSQLTHPAYTKPELVATAPNQTWSWDITRLLGPEGSRHLARGSDPPLCPLPSPRSQGQATSLHRHHDRPRAPRLHVGHRPRDRAPGDPYGKLIHSTQDRRRKGASAGELCDCEQARGDRRTWSPSRTWSRPTPPRCSRHRTFGASGGLRVPCSAGWLRWKFGTIGVLTQRVADHVSSVASRSPGDRP